jgi:hypothetical protein
LTLSRLPGEGNEHGGPWAREAGGGAFVATQRSMRTTDSTAWPMKRAATLVKRSVGSVSRACRRSTAAASAAAPRRPVPASGAPGQWAGARRSGTDAPPLPVSRRHGHPRMQVEPLEVGVQRASRGDVSSVALTPHALYPASGARPRGHPPDDGGALNRGIHGALEARLAAGRPEREPQWSEAVGRRSFVERVREELATEPCTGRCRRSMAPRCCATRRGRTGFIRAVAAISRKSLLNSKAF